MKTSIKYISIFILLLHTFLSRGQLVYTIVTSDPKWNNIVEAGVPIVHSFSFVGVGTGCTITGESSRFPGIVSTLSTGGVVGNLTVNWNNVNTATVTFRVTGCTGTTAANGTYTKSYPILNIPANISGPTNVSCGVQNVSYSVPTVLNANSYEWTYPSGWAVSGSATSNSITLQTNANGDGSVNVKAVNGALKTSSNTISITRPLPSGTPLISNFGTAQGTLTGVRLLCSNTTFTNNAVSNVQEYRWSTTGGIRVNGSTTATVTSTTSPTVSATSDGTITVQGYSNGCQNGSSPVTYTIVYGTPSTSSVTRNGSVFSGSATICRNTSQLLIATNDRATNISWSVLSGSNANLSVQSSTSATINPSTAGFINLGSTASNCFGSTTTTLYFIINSCGGFRIASNPATTTLTLIKNDDGDDVDDSTPDKIILLNGKGVEVKSADAKEMIKKKQLKDGNKIEFDVSELPRGEYYLHSYAPNHPDKDKRVEKVKVILQL